MTFENIIAFIKKHKAMLGLGAIGLEIAFLMLVIGKAIANLFRRKR